MRCIIDIALQRFSVSGLWGLKCFLVFLILTKVIQGLFQINHVPFPPTSLSHPIYIISNIGWLAVTRYLLINASEESYAYFDQYRYDLWTRTNQIKTDFEIWCRKWGWLGNILRKSPNEIARLAMDCNPQGSRGQGRSKFAWRRTELEEAKLIGKFLNEIKHSAINGVRCKNLADALCSEMA
jgi:hypothetical protein